MHNGTKTLLSIGWLIYGSMILAIILTFLGINALNYKSPNFLLGAIILAINIIISIVLALYYNEQENQEMKEYRIKQYPIVMKSIQEAKEEMLQEYPAFSDTIETCLDELVSQETKQFVRDTK